VDVVVAANPKFEAQPARWRLRRARENAANRWRAKGEMPFERVVKLEPRRQHDGCEMCVEARLTVASWEGA